MKIVRILPLAFIIFLQGCVSTEKINSINSEFENTNEAESRYVGMVGVPSEKFKKFTYLWNNLNKEEKREVSKNGRLVAKFYGSLKLVNEKSKFILEIFNANLNDQRKINYLNGDVQRPTEISMEMLNQVNELIRIKTKPNFLDKNLNSDSSRKAIKKYKKYVKLNGDNRPGFVEHLKEKLKYAMEFENWELDDLIETRDSMNQIVKKNNNRPEK